MFLMFLVQLLLTAFLVEALTQVVVKSELFGPLRKFLGRITFLDKLVTCGYCFSFWAAALVVALDIVTVRLAGAGWLNFVMWVMFIQRTSNVMHNCIDKFTDKYYSLAHTNSDK